MFVVGQDRGLSRPTFPGSKSRGNWTYLRSCTYCHCSCWIMLATWIQVFELLHLGIMCMAKLRLNRTFVDPGVWFHVLKLLGLWWRQSATKQTLPSLSLNGFDAVVAGWGSLEVSFYFFWVSRFYLACQPHGVAIWTDEGWTTKLALKFDRRPATPRIKRTPQARRKRALAKSAQKPAGKAQPPPRQSHQKRGRNQTRGQGL